MDWLPYLSQLARRPRALKYTGIYELLPKEVNTLLNSCDDKDKKEILKILAKLSIEAGFDKATLALKNAIGYGAKDAESIMAMFNRLNSKVVELEPLALQSSIPCVPSFTPGIDEYDRLILQRGADN